MLLGGQFQDPVDGPFRRPMQSIMLGPQAEELVSDIERRQDGHAVDVGRSRSLLHILHPAVDESGQFANVGPVCNPLDTVCLSEYLYLNVFHVLSRVPGRCMRRRWSPSRLAASYE